MSKKIRQAAQSFRSQPNIKICLKKKIIKNREQTSSLMRKADEELLGNVPGKRAFQELQLWLP
jgi:hypothetical protein